MRIVRCISSAPLLLVALVGVALVALGPGRQAEAQAGPPAAPSNLQQTGTTDTSITVTWNDNSFNEVVFQVAYSQVGSGVWQAPTTPANVTTFTLADLTPGSSYYFYVRACNYSGCSAWSNGIVAVAGTVPAAPTNLRQTGATGTSFTIAWDDNSTNETYFEIVYVPTTGGNWSLAYAPADATTYTLAPVAPGSSYYFYVRACNAAGCSAWSNGIIATTPPAPPTNLRLVGTTETSITIAWNDNSTNETSFQVAYSVTSETAWTFVDVPANTTTWTHTNAIREGYYYYVRACNAAGCSAWSNGIEATTQRYRIKLTWGATPRDLDSHLWVPAVESCPAFGPQGEPRNHHHVYFGTPGSTTGCPYAALDVDDVDGIGPETIAITRLQNGTYTYAVHNYSGDAPLAGSGATVQVFERTTLVATYTVPAEGSGNCWVVFELSSNGAIRPVNVLTTADPATCGQPVATPALTVATSGATADGVQQRGGSAAAPPKPQGAGSRAAVAPAAGPATPPADAPLPGRGRGRATADRVPPPPADVRAPGRGRGHATADDVPPPPADMAAPGAGR